MDTFEKWLLNTAERKFRCRFKKHNGDILLGIPHRLVDGQIILYTLDEDNLKTDELAYCDLEVLESVESIENELSNYY